MKPILELTKAEHESLRATYNRLKAYTKGLPKSDWFVDLKRRSGYASYSFSGEVSDSLLGRLGRMPTADEIIMLVDGGFSNFGAECAISGRRFAGKVYID